MADRCGLLQLGVGHVLCVNGTAEECNEHPDTFTYFNIDIDDDEDVDIGVHFADALNFIEGAKNKGSGVVVHCAAGISRSATSAGPKSQLYTLALNPIPREK